MKLVMTSKAGLIYQSLITDYPYAMQSITEISKNTSANKNFVCSQILAFNFDLVLNLNPELPNCKEKSPDALFLHNDILYFVEFKEGGVDKGDVRLKIHDGAVTLFQYARSKGIVDKDEFCSLSIRYAVIKRSTCRGNPGSEFLQTLEDSGTFFNLKNIEGLLIDKTNVVTIQYKA